ncbi:zinc ribbon domain-containing protein [Bacillus sp. NPDC094106]|uniref:zinc ribbon domain-containing protein n=1 Tax=Bacillus sp. NPDC094106 TaxID=3363949 RepID=UPI0038038450
MKFCGTCKKQVADHLNFCSECGSKVEVIEENVAASRADVYQEVQPKKSKKNIVILIVVALFVAALFGAYKFGAYKFSKEKQINTLIEAFNKKDINTIASFVKSDDPGLKITTEDIKSYLRYLKDNPSYNKNLLSYLQKQTVDQKLVDKESFVDGQIVEDGKEWLLYPKYKFSIKSYFMNVSTTAKTAEVYVNDKKATDISSEKSSKEIGPYFPGTYVVKAKAKAELTELETEKEVELAGEKDGKVDVKLPLEGNYVTISSDENSASVFVNDKKRGKLAYGSYKLGPVPADETVEVHLEKQTDFGVVKSESVKIGEQSSYYLKFPKQTSDAAIGEFVRTHIYNNVRAISLNDFSLIENDYDKSGKSYTEDRDYLQYLKKKGITEDLLKFEVRNVERQNSTKYKVTTYEEYNIRYGDGSVKFKSFSNEHIVTVSADGKILYHSIAANNTLKSEEISGPTH